MSTPFHEGTHGNLHGRDRRQKSQPAPNVGPRRCWPLRTEHYRVLREHEPVHWDPFMHAWVVTGYQEVVTVLMQYSADRTPSLEHLDSLGLTFMKPFAEVMLQQMMFMDGAMHSRLRSLCASAFTPRRVEGLRTMIESTANNLLGKVVHSGNMDLLADFANPLPAIVTAGLLGVPVEDHEKLHGWVLDIAEVLGNFQHHPDRVAEVVKSLEALKAYVADQMEVQRRSPTNGLIQSLMTAEVDRQQLSDEEVIANIIITLIGGHETTMNLIASGFLSLLRNPDSLSLLQSRPEIVSSAVEELLRFESARTAHSKDCSKRDAARRKDDQERLKSRGGPRCRKPRPEPLPKS